VTATIDPAVVQIELGLVDPPPPEPPRDVPPPDPAELRRLLVATGLALPVVALATVPAWQFPQWSWIALNLVAPVAVWGAWPFHADAVRSLRRGRPSPDLLVSLAALTALGWSLHALLTGAGTPYLEVAAGVPALALAARCAADRAARVAGAGTVVPEIGRIAGVLVPVVVTLAVGALGFWLGAGAGTAVAVPAALAVLVAGCPAVLVLAAPVALLTGAERAARSGARFTSPDALAAARRVDAVVLPTAGTLTSGRMIVHRVRPLPGGVAGEALRLAGAVHQDCTDPIGSALVAAAIAEHGALPCVSEFDLLPGLGVRGLVSELDGDVVKAHAVLAGRPELLTAHGVELPDALGDALAATDADGAVGIVVAWDGRARAVIALVADLCPGSAAAVARLRAMGVRPVLVTRDGPAEAARVAADVGIAREDVVAEVPAGLRAERVRALQAAGRVVAAVGDGRGDAAALATADLGIATGSGGAPLVLSSGELPLVVAALRLARRVVGTVRVNLGWAMAVHAAALPAAAVGLLDPVLAGLAVALAAGVAVVTGLVCLGAHRDDHSSPIRATDR